MRAPRARCGVALALGVCLLLCTSLVLAHPSGLSRGDYRRTATGIDVLLGFAPSDAALLLPELDRDQNGTLTTAELAANLELAARSALAGLDVTQGQRACPPGPTHATTSGDGGLELHAHFECPDPMLGVDVSLTLLDRLATGHRHAAHCSGSGSEQSDAIYFGEQRRFSLPPSSAPRAEPTARAAHGVGSFVWLGFEHILSGADHVAFLLALVLSAQRISALLRVISAFTVAHSLTLGLVVLRICAPPVSLVEAGIALSVAYVGVENLLGVDASKRWRLAFVFGLAHGFGFAGALTDASFPASELVSTLLLFNVGVELGQLALLAGLVPFLILLRRSPRFSAQFLRAASAAVVGSGLFWFATRCLS
ncbi:MAG TPA: HupE/UreJ family protein [Polyangiaceae bacterium]|nr:HupE/UreJ family protein [Polyangiaceae bacterium]